MSGGTVRRRIAAATVCATIASATISAPVAYSVENNTAHIATNAAFVAIPADYVHYSSEDDGPGNIIQHDYCTASPNNFGDVDFRGPCAIHDMCYEQTAQLSWPERSLARHASCQEEFRINLKANCDNQLSAESQVAERLACHAVADMYYTTVSVVAFGPI